MPQILGIMLLGGVTSLPLLAIVLTALFLAGMIERRERTVLRMGPDSLAAIGVSAAGVLVRYQLR